MTDPAREVIDRDAQGNETGRRTLTVFESLVADLQTGMSIRAACRRAGIISATFYDWERKGMDLRIRPPQDPKSKKPRRLTAQEQRYVDFSYETERARGEGEARYLGVVAEAALRPVVTKRVTTTTETDPETGAKTTRVVEETITKPRDRNAATWILERQYGESGWRPKWEGELAGAGGAPLIDPDAVAQGILAKLQAIRAGEPVEARALEEGSPEEG